MPWTQKQMLRDANGDLIPQYWDVVEQEFKPLTGRDGANDVRLTGSNVVDDFVIIQRNLGFEVPANDRLSVSITRSNMSGYAKLFIFIRASGSHDYDLDMTSYSQEREAALTNVLAYGVYRDNFEKMADRAYTKEPIRVLGDWMALFISNNSDDDMSYDVHIWGVR